MTTPGRLDRWHDMDLPVPDRVDALLAGMSRAEKIALARSDFAAVSHLGLPPLLYTDGPCGVRDAAGVTALPVSLALAATFDPDLAREYWPRAPTARSPCG